jgi:Asp-tRNA(Asn)/Glu-tRNA(Gln) amidotransferase A subunit family amidase
MTAAPRADAAEGAALHYRALTEVAEAIRRRVVSSVELVSHLIERSRALEDTLHAWITLDADGALRAAERADREIAAGRYRGPLHGIPVSAKDSFMTRGLRTTSNMRAYADWVPDRDAVVIARLREAGAVILGKTNMNETGWSLPTEHDLAPPPKNPWNPAYRAVGSSSGPGVVAAAGLSYAALGTDGGGSTRLPSGQMGLIGLKPSRGLVPHGGVLSSGEISEVGVLTRTAADAAIVLRTIAGHDPDDHATLDLDVPDYPSLLAGGVRGLRVGVPRAFIEAVPNEDEVATAFEAALDLLRDLGADVRDVDVPDMEVARAANFVVLNAVVGSGNEDYLKLPKGLLGDSARRYLATSMFLPAPAYARALRFKQHFGRVLERVFGGVDLLAMPTSPVVTAEAARRPGEHNRGINASYTAPFNLSGHPGISIPCGQGELGIPIGFQVVGPHLSEPTLLRVAHAFEAVSGAADRHPAL